MKLVEDNPLSGSSKNLKSNGLRFFGKSYFDFCEFTTVFYPKEKTQHQQFILSICDCRH